MADADPLLDPLLDEDDQQLVASLETPPAPDALIAPDIEEEIAPAVAPTISDPDAPMTQSAGQTSAPAPTGNAADVAAQKQHLADQQAGVDKATAEARAAVANQVAADAKEAAQEAAQERADYLQRRQAAERDLDSRIKAFESAKIVDPRSKNLGKARLAVIFGGLGAAFRSAGGGDSRNTALEQIMAEWREDAEIQKANIAALRESAIMARTRLADVDDGRRQMLKDADARLVSKYNLALKQGEAQLKNHGIAQAQIDADQRIIKLREARDLKLAEMRKADDAHALNQARIARLQAQAAGRQPGAPREMSELDRARIDKLKAETDRLNRRGKGGVGVSSKEKRAQEKHDAAMARERDRAQAVADEKTVHIGTERKSAQAPTKKSAEDYRVFESSAQQIEGALADLEANYKEFGVEITSALPDLVKSDAARKRAAIMESIVLPAKEVGRLGALAGPDKEILVNITGGKQAQLLGDDVGIKNLRGWLKRARSGALNSLGISADAVAAAPAPGTKPAGGKAESGTIVRPKTGPHAGKTLRARADGGWDVVSDGRR